MWQRRRAPRAVIPAPLLPGPSPHLPSLSLSGQGKPEAISAPSSGWVCPSILSIARSGRRSPKTGDQPRPWAWGPGSRPGLQVGKARPHPCPRARPSSPRAARPELTQRVRLLHPHSVHALATCRPCASSPDPQRLHLLLSQQGAPPLRSAVWTEVLGGQGLPGSLWVDRVPLTSTAASTTAP